jgi:hypothetical protein
MCLLMEVRYPQATPSNWKYHSVEEKADAELEELEDVAGEDH